MGADFGFSTILRRCVRCPITCQAPLICSRLAYRYRGVSPTLAPSYDPTAGQNPPYGANINYDLKSAPSGDVRVAILDAKGETVTDFRATKDAGVNRVW
jgi:hypothetical protein